MVRIDFYKMRPSGNMQNVCTVTKWGIIQNFLALRLNKKTKVNVTASEAQTSLAKELNSDPT